VSKRKLKTGNAVLVLKAPPFGLPKGVRDEIGWKKLLKDMVGKVYTVMGFDDYGNAELPPKPLNSVWVEPEFLKLRARTVRKSSSKRKG